MNIARKYFCSKCGRCCIAKDEVFDRGDGYCKFLNEDNECSIYEDRPEFCRTDKVYEKYYKDKMTEEEYYELTRKACNKLKYGS